MINHNCFRTWMTGPWTWMMAQMGHWTCHFDAGPSASFLTTNYECFRNQEGALDLEFWSRSINFILNDKLLLLLDLDVGTLDLSLRYWSFPNLDDGALESEFWGHSFSFIRNDKLWLFLDLDDGALDLSFWSWAPGPASFLMTNYDCFRTWMMGPWTWSFEASPSASFVIANYHCFRTWMMGHWTCHFEAGPSAQLHS